MLISSVAQYSDSQSNQVARLAPEEILAGVDSRR